MRRSKKKNVNQYKFDGPGVDFKSKLIGIADVVAPRGDEICADALSVLKTAALRNNKEKKEHKQRITVNITLKGIRLIDEATERIDHAHPISRISFISLDKADKRTFGYIVGTKDGYNFFAIKAMKEAETITATLKELFQEVYKRHQEKKDGADGEERAEEGKNDEEEAEPTLSETEVNGQMEEAEEVVEASKEKPDSQLILELNDQIEEMRNVGIMSHSTSFDMMDDPFNIKDRVDGFKVDGFDDNFAPAPAVKNSNLLDDSTALKKVELATFPGPAGIEKQTQLNTDLFSVTEPVPPVPTIKPSASYQEELSVLSQSSPQPNGNEASLMTHDPFDSLKKSINELHKQNMMQQQQQQMSFHPSFSQINQQTAPGQYQMNQQSAQYQMNQMNQQNVYNQNISNPFGNNAFAPPPVPARPGPQQPPLPSRSQPVVTNPFLSQQKPTKLAEPTNGWTVLKTSPVPPRKSFEKPPASDPFSFLNDQPALAKTQTISSQNGVGNNELFDLLG